MENRDKFKLLMGIASLAFFSFFLRTRYKKQRTNKRSSDSCYLHSDQKPQSAFKRILADNSYSPFKHLQLASQSDEESPLHSHPYESEITSLLENPQLKFDVFSKHVILEPITSHIWVDMEAQLQELAETLSKEKAFGVDTEQHSLRSFLGFTALIQISTSEEDYLVDTIALHDVMGILRPVFSNPGICKVFHGADNDVLWLQRDFHIYVVNLFDTAKACEVLTKPQKSLAYLLETYCGVSTNKLFQREDWRQRPLSEEMLEYAQTDAHFLLYIANCLISELGQWSGRDSSCPDDEFQSLFEASRRSNTVCLQLYSKEEEEFPGAYSASSILSKHSGNQLGSSSDSSERQDVIGQLCAWRDLMARIHDESLRYVLSDQGIVAVAEKNPHNEAEICNVISLTDQNMDSNFFIQSPSAVINSHATDLLCLLNQLTKLDEVFKNILQKCLGAKGTCPLSGSNYALLSKSNLKLVSGSVPKQNPARNSKKLRQKCSRQLFIQKFSCKAPVYHNCRIYAHDGRLLCYCDRRKLEWYLRRDLAKLVEENPPAIMLLFEPKGRPEDEGNDFYIQTKKNICVGCGEKKHYLRYRIIPSCYRIHFPEHLKSHRSHDIVLLCVNCHEIAHAAAEKYKKQIAVELGIPLFVQKVVNTSQSRIPNNSGLVNHDDGVSPLQLRSAAMALLRHGPSMPAKRCEELYQIVKKYYGGREISEDDLERAMLVGMTPHERRRLEKKKGISRKHSQEYALSNKVLEDSGSSSAPAAEDTSEGGAVYNSKNGIEAYPGEKDQDLSITEDSVDISETTIVISCEHELEDPSIKEKTDAETLSLSELNEEAVVACIEWKQGLETKDTSDAQTSFDQTLEFSYSTSNGTGSPKHHSKLSLLGHGPHGKQVVDHLLNEHGEDGILLFCQKDTSDACIEWKQGLETKDTSDACIEWKQGLETKDTSDAQTSFDQTLEFSYSTSNGTGSPKHHSKLSLLGHGPHGKQVVDHLLNEHGEDGILLFCQKWRQVFVAAVHPRFLAPGWDVMHSGRRDFGEFSVYNPAKSISSDANI